MRLSLLLILVSMLTPLAEGQDVKSEPQTGPWLGWLESPGGDIPFDLALNKIGTRWTATLKNADERISVKRIDWDGSALVLHLAPYDSTMRGRVLDDGKRMAGEWKRYTGKNTWTRMRFGAVAGERPRFRMKRPEPGSPKIDGRWAVQFAQDEHPSVGVFETLDDGTVQGTFLTTLGDYRYNGGFFDGERLFLSTFDGAHAFLFKARIQDDGTLAGDFWSRDAWHDTWTGKRDPEATLPDPLGLTKWVGGVPLKDVFFPDLDGRRRSLADPLFEGRARLFVLFGTWCPNCNDATDYLVELDRKYGDKGLSIIGLAFEFGDDFKRNSDTVRAYAEHHGAQYPMLIAGTSDKAEASEAFPLLDRVRAFPTFIFIDAMGIVRGVYTGFSGPATGRENVRLREQFEGLVEELAGISVDRRLRR
jgi:thiol-disulfide isomerase/thioredoxin